ncbi:hypothetical protein PAMA_005724 [Pampus argenteus]
MAIVGELDYRFQEIMSRFFCLTASAAGTCWTFEMRCCYCISRTALHLETYVAKGTRWQVDLQGGAMDVTTFTNKPPQTEREGSCIFSQRYMSLQYNKEKLQPLNDKFIFYQKAFGAARIQLRGQLTVYGALIANLPFCFLPFLPVPACPPPTQELHRSQPFNPISSASDSYLYVHELNLSSKRSSLGADWTEPSPSQACSRSQTRTTATEQRWSPQLIASKAATETHINTRCQTTDDDKYCLTPM